MLTINKKATQTKIDLLRPQRAHVRIQIIPIAHLKMVNAAKRRENRHCATTMPAKRNPKPKSENTARYKVHEDEQQATANKFLHCCKSINMMAHQRHSVEI